MNYMNKFQWTSKKSHTNGSEVMDEYVKNYLPLSWRVIIQNGSYAEIYDRIQKIRYGINAHIVGGPKDCEITFGNPK